MYLYAANYQVFKKMLHSSRALIRCTRPERERINAVGTPPLPSVKIVPPFGKIVLLSFGTSCKSISSLTATS